MRVRHSRIAVHAPRHLHIPPLSDIHFCQFFIQFLPFSCRRLIFIAQAMRENICQIHHYLRVQLGSGLNLAGLQPFGWWADQPAVLLPASAG